MSAIDILMPEYVTGPVEVLHLSPRGTFAAVKLTGTPHKGTVDVFHVGTGKRATPPRHFPSIRNLTAAKALADDLDAFDPVEPDGTLRVTSADYHQHIAAFVKELA